MKNPLKILNFCNFRYFENCFVEDYLQKFLGSINANKFCDLRVLVSNHKVIACMKRTSRHYLTNIYQGAEFQKGKLSKNLTNLSEKI